MKWVSAPSVIKRQSLAVGVARISTTTKMAFKVCPILAQISSFYSPKLVQSRFAQPVLAELMKQATTQLSRKFPRTKGFNFNLDIERTFKSVEVNSGLLTLPPWRILHEHPDQLAVYESFATHNELVLEATSSLMKGSMAQAFVRSGLQADQISQYVNHTSSYQLPQADVDAHEELQISPDAMRTGIAPSGCVGGLTVIIDAAGRVTADMPIVMTTTAECASLSWSSGIQPTMIRAMALYERGNITEAEFRRRMTNAWITGALFKDAGATAVITHPDSVLEIPSIQLRKTRGECIVLPEIVAFHSETIPNSRHIVKVEQGVNGTHVELSPKLPAVVVQHELRILEKLLAKAGIEDWRQQKVKFYPHCGGPKILNDFAHLVKRPRSDFKHSWASLNENGNCGSVSICDIAERAQREDPLSVGEIGVLLGVGPGVQMSGVVLRGVQVN